MKALLRKELFLTLHPTAILFLTLSALMLVPGYPYLVTFFYTGLAVFFTCLNGREQHDVFYSVSQPVTRKNIVLARYLIVVGLQLTQLLLALPFAFLRQMLNIPENPVGMEANLALFGFAFLLLGLFNLSFFGTYYRDVGRVGAAMAKSSIVVGLFITAVEACTHIIPLFRDRLDTIGTVYLTEKLLVLLVGAASYLALTLLSYQRAVKNFSKQDL